MIEKKIIHKELAAGRWFTFSLVKQLANVGSDVERTIQWKNKGNVEYSKDACIRALELLDLTVADPKNKPRLKEILRVRHMLADHYLGINEFKFTDQYWQNYFFDFAYAAALERKR
ncbi:hypothetical protein A3J41_02490 [candidate division TM6 bacterium RIFCSPHIGHO2_12_FULL_38_8]|nr:MAG: hypothetical protein A3J41_02490 [candidate division TM6 bacterium RIFCSPHIGHO2_12_FULL_38_8]